MNKDTIRCPICKGQHITIIEEIARDRYFHIDKGKLFEVSSGTEKITGKITICCEDCLQDEKVEDPAWKPSSDEKIIIHRILMTPRIADVSKYLID